MNITQVEDSFVYIPSALPEMWLTVPFLSFIPQFWTWWEFYNRNQDLPQYYYLQTAMVASALLFYALAFTVGCPYDLYFMYYTYLHIIGEMVYVYLLSKTMGDPKLTTREYYLSARFIFDTTKSIFNIIFSIAAIPAIKHYTDYIECEPTYCDEPEVTEVPETQIIDVIYKKKAATEQPVP